MHIEKDIVVSLHYRLTDDQQQEIENSFGDVPMSYLHGHNTMIPGLEAAVEGKQAGDRLDVTISPEMAMANTLKSVSNKYQQRHLKD